MANTNTITFRIGEETRPVLEVDNLHESIFSELYQKAFAEIDNYIGKVEDIKEKERDGYVYEGVNNIFAFIGERGAGKTSCMMSVAKALEYKDQNLLMISGLDNIKQTTFLNSILIDPAFFDQNNNILSLIIAHLFQTFRDQASKSDCKIDEEKRRALIGCFEKVQKNLNNLFPKENNLYTDTLEGLVNFSAAIDLQKNIKALVDAYLDFMSETKAKFLVLMIDDIDLHTKHAREMVEQIRKYFIQPNIVILMAVKIDQLSHVIKNGLSDEYKPLIDKKAMPLEVINEMVDRYLVKLLPHSHRIYLPDASVYFYSSLKITFNKKGRDDIEYSSVRKGVLSLIFEKTRYLFYNSIDTTSYIIPRNLRELRQIIALLAEMDTFRNPEKEAEPKKNKLWLKVREYNQALFLKYFKETWCVNNLTEKSALYIFELFKVADPLLINKTILKFIQTYFQEYIGDESNKKNEKDSFYLILKPQNKTYNISLGDVMFVLNELLSILSVDKDRNFIYAIKAFYSFKLYEYYNELDIQNDIESTEIISITDSLSQFSNLEKLIAGTFIETRNNDIIDSRSVRVLQKPKFKKTEIDEQKVLKFKNLLQNKQYDELFIFYNLALNTNVDNSLILSNSLYNAYLEQEENLDLLHIVNSCSETNNLQKSLCNYIIDKETYSLQKTVSRSLTIVKANVIRDYIKSIFKEGGEDKKESMALIEMILTLISRRPNTDDEKNYRIKDEVRFNPNLKSANQKNLYFDIYAPFFNLLDLRKCYERFDIYDNQIDIFKQSLLNDKSLIAKLYAKLINERPESKSCVDDFIQIRSMYEPLNVKDLPFKKLNENIIKYKEIGAKYEYDMEEFKEYDLQSTLESISEGRKCLQNELISLLEYLYNAIKPYLNSWVTIRNVEFLDALVTNISNHKDSLRGDELTTYKKYFDLVSQFSVDAYNGSKDGGDEMYNINLSFMSVYSDIIEESQECKGKTEKRLLFEEIFPTSVTEKVYETLYF